MGGRGSLRIGRNVRGPSGFERTRETAIIHGRFPLPISRKSVSVETALGQFARELHATPEMFEDLFNYRWAAVLPPVATFLLRFWTARKDCP